MPVVSTNSPHATVCFADANVPVPDAVPRYIAGKLPGRIALHAWICNGFAGFARQGVLH
ncbi:hypothetical protein PSAC2689_70349 [Paraburkholderia sacchari]